MALLLLKQLVQHIRRLITENNYYYISRQWSNKKFNDLRNWNFWFILQQQEVYYLCYLKEVEVTSSTRLTANTGQVGWFNKWRWSIQITNFSINMKILVLMKHNHGTGSGIVETGKFFGSSPSNNCINYYY